MALDYKLYSYFFLLPFEISITEIKSVGKILSSLISCHILPILTSSLFPHIRRAVFLQILSGYLLCGNVLFKFII